MEGKGPVIGLELSGTTGRVCCVTVVCGTIAGDTGPLLVTSGGMLVGGAGVFCIGSMDGLVKGIGVGTLTGAPPVPIRIFPRSTA